MRTAVVGQERKMTCDVFQKNMIYLEKGPPGHDGAKESIIQKQYVDINLTGL